MITDHFPYIWAAYVKGAFKPEEIPPGLNAKDFEAHLIQLVSDYLNATASEMLTVFARTPEGVIPLAIVTVEYALDLAFPHVYWFPWASPRNKIEAALRFFIDLKKANKVLVTTQAEGDVKFFAHLCKYGLMRAVGKIRDWPKQGEGTMLFESVGS